MKYQALFKPGKIGNVEIPNRIVQSPVQSRGGDEEGFVTQELLDYHMARLNPGPGLVMAQQTFAWPGVKLKRGLALWDDMYIEKMQGLAETIKGAGSKVFLQLGGSGSRLAGNAIAPSPVAGSWDGLIPKELTWSDMKHFMECYAAAGKRLHAAGFDGFSLQAGAGKYVAQFLSPHSNRRQDDFGGSPKNRVRYPLMIINAIREHTGKDFPLLMRLDIYDCMEGGLSFDEGMEQLHLLHEGGVDAFILGSGGQERLWHDCPSYLIPSKDMRSFAARVKSAAPHITIVAGGGVPEPALAEAMITQGEADFVSFCRPLLAEPRLVEKIQQGKVADIRQCLRCNNCQTWGERPHLANRGICCTMNPALMVEKNFEAKQAQKIKSFVVAGGGPAGMAAACTLAERGHKVVLYEASPELGGQWLAAQAMEKEGPYNSLVPYFRKRMQEAGVQVHLSTPLTAKLMQQIPADALIIATGAKPRALTQVDTTVNHLPRVFAIDVLQGKATVGKKVVVLGGRYIGLETALKLARAGHEVSLVEMTELGRGLISRIRGLLFEKLSVAGVRFFPHSNLFRLCSHHVEVRHGGALFFIDADSLVLAIGTEPDTCLQKDIETNGINKEVYVIGDALKIGDAREAITQGTELGLRL